MQPALKPTKQEVRHWTQQRQAERKPPPTPEEIRRQLGWGMLASGKTDDRGR